MKSMNQVAKSHSFPQLQRDAMTSLDSQAAYDINDVFKSLKAIFPSNFRVIFPDDAALGVAKRVWVKTLIEGNVVTHEQIRIGMKRARASGDFVPSAGKFVTWCQVTAEDMGLPSCEAAYREAIGNLGSFITTEWSHPAVREAVITTTCYTLKNSPERESRALFYKNYAVMVERVRRGEKLTIALPDKRDQRPVYIPVAPDVERSHLETLKKMVGLV